MTSIPGPTAAPRTIRIWAVYRSPFGAPAPFVAQAWEFGLGHRAPVGDPIYAASLEQARETFPRAGLARKEPRKVPFEAERLVETWEPSQEEK